jgi:hypothetical protein
MIRPKLMYALKQARRNGHAVPTSDLQHPSQALASTCDRSRTIMQVSVKLTRKLSTGSAEESQSLAVNSWPDLISGRAVRAFSVWCIDVHH